MGTTLSPRSSHALLLVSADISLAAGAKLLRHTLLWAQSVYSS